jgi:undecaprenyl pyrophosphate synthase
LNYNPIDELRQAKINSTKLEFWKSLWVPHGLDIIFRSGEAKTLSEFLPLQSAYANLVFFDNLFNDIPYVMFSKEVERIRSLHLRYGD